MLIQIKNVVTKIKNIFYKLMYTKTKMKKTCILLLNLELCNYILMTGYINKKINSNTYEATVYMLKNEKNDEKKIDINFLHTQSVFFLKNTNFSAKLNVVFWEDDKKNLIEGNIMHIISYILEPKLDLYKVRIIFDIKNNSNLILTNMDIIIIGDKNLDDIAGFFYLE